MPTKRLFVHLTGGLGNQMFQYAMARALALRTGAGLVLDSWSGFVRDAQYRNRYALGGLPIVAEVAGKWERLPVWLYRADVKLRTAALSPVQMRPYGAFLVETGPRYLEESEHFDFRRTAWLVGYWQSPRYFEAVTTTIQSELMPAPPCQRKLLQLGEILRSTESVALGIRLYEESVNPAAHARDGKVKTVHEVNAAVDRVVAKCSGARFFVFCTYRSPVLAELHVPEGTVFVTPDDGYEGAALETLWLLTQCKHHIFTNSSYYWWGAWLSSGRHSADHGSRYILAADNFINGDGLCDEWERF